MAPTAAARTFWTLVGQTTRPECAQWSARTLKRASDWAKLASKESPTKETVDPAFRVFVEAFAVLARGEAGVLDCPRTLARAVHASPFVDDRVLESASSTLGLDCSEYAIERSRLINGLSAQFESESDVKRRAARVLARELRRRAAAGDGRASALVRQRALSSREAHWIDVLLACVLDAEKNDRRDWALAALLGAPRISSLVAGADPELVERCAARHASLRVLATSERETISLE